MLRREMAVGNTATEHGGQGAPEGSRTVSQRRDSVASRQRLLAATGRLLARGERPRNLQQVAAEAGLAAATAYRHFESLDAALQAYAHFTIVSMQQFAAEQEATGSELLRILSTEWVRLIRERGPAMVHLRSPDGFLHRRRSGDRLITDTCTYLEPAVRGILAEIGLPADALEYALFLWNVMFDPREVLDLLYTLGWPGDVLVDRLMASYFPALRAFAKGTSSG
jgi:AcrR family transcriptional regulator